MIQTDKTDKQSWAMDLLTRYRGLVLVGLGLPLGMAFDTALRVEGALRRLGERLLGRGRAQHDQRTAAVQEQVRRWAEQPRDQRRPLCTDRRTWMNLSTRFEPKEQWHRVRMSGLRNILSLDPEHKLVRVEPLVTVGQITRYLLPRGYMLAVNLEIAEATLGGLAMAVGMTTHSHKVGLLQETVVAYEVVLADGTLVRVTEDEHPDLFRALPWSHGTLGLLVGLELRVIPVKSHVHLRYEPVHGKDAYCQRLAALSTAPDAPDFVEATVYSKERAVIMAGTFADLTTAEQRRKVNRIGLWWKPWFYKHVARYQDQGGDEFIPLRHYLLRHNRSIFWVVEDMISFGNHPVFRWLLGWMMPPKVAFLKFSTTPAVRKMTYTMQVFQDIVLPMSAMGQAIDRAHDLLEIYPILLYPSRIYDHRGQPGTSGEAQGQLRPPPRSELVPGTTHGMYFDLGVYGVPLQIKQGRTFNTVQAMRQMEAFTREVGGYPFLYADTFMTRQEFRHMFDLTLYDEVRRKYGAEGAFPDLYDKIKPEVDVLAGQAKEVPDLGDQGPAPRPLLPRPETAVSAGASQ